MLPKYLKPVSYTHLDVYKRQQYRPTGQRSKGRPREALMKWMCTYFPWDMNRRFTYSLIEGKEIMSSV